MRDCAVMGCDRVSVARGLCTRCYARWQRGVTPLDSPRHYATKDDKQRMRYEVSQRRVAGEGVVDIAASVGVDASTLGKWFREWGVTAAPGRRVRARAPKQWQPWTREQATLAYTRTDLSIGERAAVLGRSYAAVQAYIRKYRRRADDPYGIKS